MKFETKKLFMGIISFIAAACIAVGSFMWFLSETLTELRVGMSNIQGEIHVLSTRMDGVEKNTESLNVRMTRMEEKVTRVEANTENLNARLTRVEENTESLKEKVNSLEVKVNRVEVEVRSTNEYLRKSENQDVPKDTSASDLTPVSP